MKNIRFSILLLACLCSVQVQAQSDQCLGSNWQPYINKLNVDPLTGEITITWDMPPVNPKCPVPDKYILAWYEERSGGNSNHAFDSIMEPAPRSYSFYYDDMVLKHPDMPDPRLTSVAFTVRGVDSEDNRGLRSVAHYNIQVSNHYDSCRAEIKLNWHRYRTWQSNTLPNKPLVGYHVMRINNGVHELVKEMSESDTVYVERPVGENETYEYYIKAIRSDGEYVTSFHTVRETHMPIPPTFITAVGTEYNSDGLAEIEFLLDPNAETHLYEFLGSSNPDYSFVSLGTYNIYGDTVLTDRQKRERTYYYKLEAWHLCKNKYINTAGMANMATALWLSQKQDGQVNSLFWDLYRDWDGEVQYSIYRQISDHPEEIIASFTDPETTIYQDDMTGVFIDGNVCYWIVAKPVTASSHGHTEQAESNHICIIPESDIFVPKAFTPDVAGINSIFKPFFSYPPEKYSNDYLFIVYDRTGAKLFELREYNDTGWDGHLKNGKLAGEGVYVYYVKFRTDRGRLVEKKGTFSLILP